jgi:ribosomal protein S12 methylthiotransferase accessory factor
MTPGRPVEVELRDVEWSDPVQTIRLGARMISSKVGLIQAVSYGVHLAQDSAWFALGAANPDLSRFSDILNANKSGGGGESLEIALAATIGETVERYCMLFYDKSEMVHAAYKDVKDDAVSPEELRLYSRAQVDQAGPQVRLDYFDDDLKIHWVWGYSLTHNRPRLVPATLVYMQYRLDDGEKSPGRNASTGLAAGLTREQAILTGLYEVIERDAFTISWLHRRVGPRVAIDDPDLQALGRQRFYGDHPAVDFRIFDITLDIPVFSVFGVLRRPAEFGQVVCVSSVSRLNPTDAIGKCFREVGQGMPYLRYLRSQLDGWEPAADHSDLTSFDHHYTYYSLKPEMIPKAFAFCDEVTEERALSRIPNRSTGRVAGDLRHCIELLSSVGREAIVVDVTTEEITELGFSVVRVLVPGLVPLHGNHNFQYLGVNRLHEVSRLLGWENGHSQSELSPYPHPFP